MVVIGASSIKPLPLAVFLAVVAVTLCVTYWAARRTRTATQFWAAGRGISSLQNGLAIAGDYMSAAAFLGVAGLIFLYGFDGFVTGIAALVSFVPVMLLLAERMRNAGKFTMADVFAFRLREAPARTAAAVGTLCVTIIYLIAQMIAAGTLIESLAGLSFALAVVITGACMLAYVLFGGMLATTWVQIIKAVLLLGGVAAMTIWLLARFGFDPFGILDAAASKSGHGRAILGPGVYFKNPFDLISIGLAFGLGTAGLPHILMRFFTVPNARAARGSVGWAVTFIGCFYVMIAIVGYGARAVLGSGADKAVGSSGNLAAPLLAQALGGGSSSPGGQVFYAVISGVAFATILAVVAGLVLSAAAAVGHDLWTSLMRRERSSERHQVIVGRVAATGVGAISIALAIVAGKGFNIQLLVGLAFSVAASANFPALVLAMLWPRFNTAGAVTGVAFGLVSSIALIVLSRQVSGPHALFALQNPAIISIPIGFLGCLVGTLLGRERGAEQAHRELRVRSETGIGAEQPESTIAAGS